MVQTQQIHVFFLENSSAFMYRPTLLLFIIIYYNVFILSLVWCGKHVSCIVSNIIIIYIFNVVLLVNTSSKCIYFTSLSILS